MNCSGLELQVNPPSIMQIGISRKRSVVHEGIAILALLAFVFLLPGTAFAAVSSENFDSLTAQIISNTDSTNFDGDTSWTFGHGPTDAQITLAGNSNGGTFTNGLSNDFPGDSVLFLNYNGIPNGSLSGNVTHFYLKSTDGSNFKLDSFQAGNNLAGYSTTGTITILLDGNPVGSTSFDLNLSSSANGITYSYEGDSSGGSARPYGTFTFDATKYRNVDEINLDYPASSTPLFENLTISAAVANAIPTVSSQPATLSFDKDTEGDVNLAGITFADGNGDILTVTLAVDAGTFGATVADGSGIGGGVTATRVSDTVVTLEGAAVDINTYLTTVSNITYIPPLNTSGMGVAALTISANDGFDNLASDPTVNINVIAPLPVPTQAIPTLGGWARILLMVLLGLIGAFYFPRRYIK